MATPMLGTLALDGLDEYGVRWSFQRGHSLYDSAESTASAQQRARASGGTSGEAFDRARHDAFQVLIAAPDHASRLAAQDRLKAAACLCLTPFVGPDGRRTDVRREGAVLFKDETATVTRASVALLAPDPRRFDPTLSVEVRLPSTSGGLTWPVAWPVTWTDVTQTGEGSLTNPGNAAGPVRLRLDGPSNPADPPLVGPVVTHVSSGQRLVFASSLTLAHGEFVTVDMERREVLAQGIEPRNGWVLRSAANFGWAAFQPGANVWSFTAQAASASALLTVEADPAWQ